MLPAFAVRSARGRLVASAASRPVAAAASSSPSLFGGSAAFSSSPSPSPSPSFQQSQQQQSQQQSRQAPSHVTTGYVRNPDISRKLLIDEMLRVNQAGEVGAVQIYAGQQWVLRGTPAEATLEVSAR